MCHRPTGTGSTATERSLAKDFTKNVRDYLSDQGWPQPTLISSGNGYQLLYRVAKCPPTSTSMRGALEALGKRFDNDSVHIDRCVHNAAKIARLPWTVNRKGRNTTERPHRRAKVLSLGDTIGVDDSSIMLLAERLAEVNLGAEEQRRTKSKPAAGLVSYQPRTSGSPECLLSEADVRRLIDLCSDVLPLKGVYRVGKGNSFQLATCPVKGSPHHNQTLGTGKTAIFGNQEHSVSSVFPMIAAM